MEDTKQTVFIVDVYSKYANERVIFTFFINGREYAVKETTLEWGIPVISSIEESAAQPYFKLYNTLEEAKEYVRQLKQLEGR